MKVYILICISKTYIEILGVYSTEEKATKAHNSFSYYAGISINSNQLSICVREIDENNQKKEVKMKETKKEKNKVKKVMKEGYEGKLHSGSKKGPLVTNPKQMQAIAMSEAGISKKGKK